MSSAVDFGFCDQYLFYGLIKMFITIYKLLKKQYDKKYERISVQEAAAKTVTCSHRRQAATSPDAAPSTTTTKETVANDEVCATCKQEKHDATVYRWKLIGGLLLPYTLASLDLTIVASSLPFIASYFGTYTLLLSVLLRLTICTR